MKRNFDRPRYERTYVTVNTDFDPTGFLRPVVVKWDDAHVYPIEKITDFRPAGTVGNLYGDCYTIVVRGQVRHLYFEKTDPTFKSLVGRWFFLTPIPQ